MPPEPLGSVLWNPDAAALGAHNALICETGRKQIGEAGASASALGWRT